MVVTTVQRKRMWRKVINELVRGGASFTLSRVHSSAAVIIVIVLMQRPKGVAATHGAALLPGKRV